VPFPRPLVRFPRMSLTPARRAGTHLQARTGVAGLDDILNGGFPPQRVYLVQGDPGAGKTTLGLQFLLEGVKLGERALYVTLSENERELADVAASHGWSLEGLSILEVSSDLTGEELETTLYEPAEVELGERMRALLEETDRLRPARMVLDSCSELRLLAQSPLRYRRQILALKQRLTEHGCTILLLDNPHPGAPDMVLQSVVHGVLELEQLAPEFGAERRRLRVVKLRGLRYRGGFHDFAIRTGGLEVFPRLVAAEHHRDFPRDAVTSGVAGLDAMTGGGVDRGTSLLLMGPSGSGKSAVAAQYAAATAARGERVAVFAFDESAAMALARADSLGMPLRTHLESGRLSVRQIDPAELSPGEFVQVVRDAVEREDARVVVIDSLNGFLASMSEEKLVTLQLHELLAFLNQRGVLTVLTLAQHGLVSGENESPVDVSYLADAVLLFRYFEATGQVRKALSMVKKRSGAHESTIRELVLGPGGVRVGPVLSQFHGVLAGAPMYSGVTAASGQLLDDDR
jgi:circadian clock protein KaiC